MPRASRVSMLETIDDFGVVEGRFDDPKPVFFSTPRAGVFKKFRLRMDGVGLEEQRWRSAMGPRHVRGVVGRMLASFGL